MKIKKAYFVIDGEWGMDIPNIYDEHEMDKRISESLGVLSEYDFNCIGEAETKIDARAMYERQIQMERIDIAFGW